MNRRNFIRYLSIGVASTFIPDNIYSKSKTDIYLTIDDGPRDSMKDILSSLGYNSSTFFMIGRNLEKNKEIAKNALEKGHLIGNHTYSHYKFSNLSMDMVKEEIEKTHSLIDEVYNDVSIENPKLFRFPYGDRGFKENKKEISKFLEDLGYKTYFWNIDSEDWKYYRGRKSLDAILDEVDRVKDNEIILCHDLEITSKYIIPHLISKKKYNFKTL